jgi:hypothetical protein
MVAGSFYFDPTDTKWQLTGSSTVTYVMLLETTSAGNAANGELFRQTGTGSPVIVCTVPTTTSVTAARCAVATGIINTTAPGIFVCRAWITTPNGNDYATVTGAWLEVQP